MRLFGTDRTSETCKTILWKAKHPIQTTFTCLQDYDVYMGCFPCHKPYIDCIIGEFEINDKFEDSILMVSRCSNPGPGMIDAVLLHNLAVGGRDEKGRC